MRFRSSSSKRKWLRGVYMWVGAALGVVVGFLASSFVGNLGLALGVGAVAGMVFGQAAFFRR
jgi:uncharacterized membrane protein YoaK (UPF0700 family)